MCGIAGFAGFGTLDKPPAEVIAAMTSMLAHRGPDGQGTWIDAAHGIALGHRRLAIIDPSPAGAQPMLSHSGRLAITFNGEIYNYAQMRADLEASGHGGAWRGHSDTEVLLEAIEAWGLEAALRRAIGMFAFALWDRASRSLTIARDRMGEKPLYHGWIGGSFAFASELKALARHPAWAPQLDREALTLFLRYNCIPAPRSIWKGISKLAPGHYLTLSQADAQARRHPQPVAYWLLRDAIESARGNPFAGTLEDAATELDTRLREVLRGQMIADVPLGAFLSGGIDSSALVALMQALSARPVKTFTVGFAESAYDEAAHARALAAHLGTEHHEIVLAPRDALDVVPLLGSMYDEPFADSSQIPTFLVSRFARTQVTVGLTGDGGDEVFGGYNRYEWIPRLARGMAGVPRPLRRIAGSLAGAVPARMAAAIAERVPGGPRAGTASDRIPKMIAALGAEDEAGLYASVVSHWSAPESLVAGAREPGSRARSYPGDAPDFADFREWMMYTDSLTYLPDDILAKVDRASMAASLETRVPYLDPRIIALAWSLPIAWRAERGESKKVLRRMLHRYVPAALVERPKAGFAIPLARWLRHELRDWAEALLEPERIAREGIFDPAPIRKAWDEHLSGRRDWQHHLWDILMFQAWHEGQRNALDRTP